MQLPETAKMAQQMLHMFAENEMRPVAPHYDEVEEMPWELMEKAEMFGMTQYSNLEGNPAAKVTGGDDSKTDADGKPKAGITNRVMMVGAEELAWGCAGIALALNGSGLACAPVAQMGTEEQKKMMLDLMKGKDENGRVKLAAMAMSEPTTGSDISDIRTVAEKDGDHYIINGSKQWITNAKSANVYVVWAQTDKSLGRAGVKGFIIPRDTDGLIPGHKEVKLGIRASETAQLHFENCRVPKDWVLGGEEAASKKGLKGAHAMFDATRPLVGAQGVGIARAAFDYMVEYGKEESLYGKPLCEHQWFAFEIAEMAMQIEAARAMVHKAVWMADHKLPNADVAAMSKALGATAAQDVTTRAIRLLGEEGWTKAHPVEKWYRDAKIYDIFEGTGQIQRRIIAKNIFGVNAT